MTQSSRATLHDGGQPFDVTRVDATRTSPERIVLFAVGGGGDPERHGPLLAALAERGCTVVAPHFDRLRSPELAEADLQLRARRLMLALDSLPDAATGVTEVVGVGHSIGATMLLALAGGVMCMRDGRALGIPRDERLRRLALMAPPTGFFQAPGALDAVRTPIQLWAAVEDVITPPAQALVLERALAGRTRVDLDLIPRINHFSFVHTAPLAAGETPADRDAFLARLTEAVCRFVLA